MHVIVTGAAGFIGSHLSDRLLAEGHTVTGIDSLATGRRENVAVEVNFFHQDIAGIEFVMPEVATPDLVIHCAASYKDPDKWRRDTETNVLGTIDVTRAAQKAGCPIVYMQTALPPVSSYAISKTAGMQYIQQSGVPHLIFRLANIYGPRNLSGPIPTFYKRIAAGEPCTVVDTTRDMVFIEDLVDCITDAIHEGVVGVYDVCSGNSTSIHDLYKLVQRHRMLDSFPTAAIVVPPEPDEAMTSVSVDQLIPGWEATTYIGDGIKAACDWYHDNPPAETFTHLRQVEHV